MTEDAVVRADERRQHRDREVDACQADEAVDDPCDRVRGSKGLAEDLGHEIPLEERHETPVERADDDEDQRDDVEPLHGSSSTWTLLGHYLDKIILANRLEAAQFRDEAS